MAGRKKREGIDFSGWDVDVFEDEKIIQLVDRLGLNSEVTGQYISDVVDLCLDLGLFHADTFAQYGVLTSRAIQRNFVVVLQRRRRKEVFRGIWLLSEAESGSAVLVDANEDDF